MKLQTKAMKRSRNLQRDELRIPQQQQRVYKGPLFVACLLIRSPYSFAWPRKLISGTCNTPHPLCRPVRQPTLAAACSPNTNTQAPPRPRLCPESPTRCVRAHILAGCVTESPRCHVRGQSGASACTCEHNKWLSAHAAQYVRFTREGMRRLCSVNVRGGF